MRLAAAATPWLLLLLLSTSAVDSLQPGEQLLAGVGADNQEDRQNGDLEGEIIEAITEEGYIQSEPEVSKQSGHRDLIQFVDCLHSIVLPYLQHVPLLPSHTLLRT